MMVVVVAAAAAQEYTSIEEPFFIYDPINGISVKGVDGVGILYHAVDHLPSECAKCVRPGIHGCCAPPTVDTLLVCRACCVLQGGERALRRVLDAVLACVGALRWHAAFRGAE